jgi:hypothetical protein
MLALAASIQEAHAVRQNVIINRHFLGDIFATTGKIPST